MRICKKTASILLSLIMIFSVFTIIPVTASAQTHEEYIDSLERTVGEYVKADALDCVTIRLRPHNSHMTVTINQDGEGNQNAAHLYYLGHSSRLYLKKVENEDEMFQILFYKHESENNPKSTGDHLLTAENNADNAVVHVENDNSGEDAKRSYWKFIPQSDGSYKIYNQKFNKYWSVNDLDDISSKDNKITVRSTGLTWDLEIVSTKSYENNVTQGEEKVTIEQAKRYDTYVVNRDGRRINSLDWMSYIPDDTKLGDLNIPGTHDVATVNVDDGTTKRCQQLYIDDLLKAGVRHFDLRFKSEGNTEDTIRFVHADEPCKNRANNNLTMSTVMGWFREFLQKHPDECLIFQIMEDRGDGDYNLYNYLKDQAQQDDSIIWSGVGMPTMGELRGKIYIISRLLHSDLMKSGHEVETSEAYLYKIRKNDQTVKWALDVRDIYTESDDGYPAYGDTIDGTQVWMQDDWSHNGTDKWKIVDKSLNPQNNDRCIQAIHDAARNNLDEDVLALIYTSCSAGSSHTPFDNAKEIHQKLFASSWYTPQLYTGILCNNFLDEHFSYLIWSSNFTRIQGIRIPACYKHTMTHYAAVAPTYDADTDTYTDGNIEYWYCPVCDRFYSDENGETEITQAQTVLPYFTINDNGTYVRVTKYNGTDAVVVIPDTVPDNYPDEALRGKKITSVNQSAFKNNTTVTKVTMGNNIKHIGWEAFRRCSNLEEITIGSGLTTLESSVFYDCSALNKVTCTATEGTIALTRYPFYNISDITFYGYHAGAFRNAVKSNSFMYSGQGKYIGIDAHTYSNPTWNWADDYSAATAEFTCTKCAYKETVDATVSNKTQDDVIVYTATVEIGSETYTDQKEVDRECFTGHSLTLDGDIGVNYFVDLTDEELARGATVNFSWTVNGVEKTHSVDLTANDKTSHGYKAKVNVAVAEMTYDITATLTIGEEQVETDTYSAVQYSDVILTDESFKTKFIAEKGADKYDQLVLLVKTMLDYGAKAQTQFHRDEDNLANAKLTSDDDTSLYYYNPDAVDANAISTGASIMTDGLHEGLEYKGTTIVYLTQTSIRHYYQGDLGDATVTFDGKAVSPVQKGDEFYFELKNIAAADLDKLYTLTINGVEYKYSVLDYVKACLTSDKTTDNMKALAAATYRYNQAANDYFGR